MLEAFRYYELLIYNANVDIAFLIKAQQFKLSLFVCFSVAGSFRRRYIWKVKRMTSMRKIVILFALQWP